MGKSTRQQCRRIQREFGEVEWKVHDWQPMKFDRTEEDPVLVPRMIDIYSNDTYHCIVREYEDCTHLSIKRLDRLPVHNWRHLQQIKNDICGEEREGVELYPAMSRIVDAANQYHLWVYRVPLGVGFQGRLVNQNQITNEEDSL